VLHPLILSLEEVRERKSCTRRSRPCGLRIIVTDPSRAVCIV
jgi:hypothetical protein